MSPLTPADHIEINQLYSKYSYALDTGDGPGRAATFTSDGCFKAAINNHVPDSPQQMAERTTRLGNHGQRHLMMNVIITATAEGAAGRGYAVILGPSKEGPGDRVLEAKSGFYVDTLVRTSEGWRFRTREFWNDGEADSPFRKGAPPPQMPWR